MKIALTSISVNDPLAAFKFYTEKLGFIEKLYMPEMRLAIVVSPEQPEGTALLLEPNENLNTREYYEGIYNAEMPVIVFGVEDVQSEYQRLTGLGVRFIKPPTITDWGTEAIFDDTCGNYIQLHQP